MDDDADAEADAPAPDGRGLLVVHHSRTGGTWTLTDAAVAGATEAVGGALDIRVLGAFDAGPQEVLRARGLLLATPARFGYMSGAMKDFFERIYHPCLEETRGLPYALLVKGGTDTSGAVDSVARVATGLAWRRVLPPLEVVGDVDEAHRRSAAELGATLAAGLEAGIF